MIKKRLETSQCVLHVRCTAPTGSCLTLAIYPMSRMLRITMQQLHFLWWCPSGVSWTKYEGIISYIYPIITRNNTYFIAWAVVLTSFPFLAVIFLEFWKRKQAIIAWEWDLISVEEDELPLPQYEAKVKTTR